MSQTEGIEILEEELHGHKVTTTRIQTEQVAEEFQKPIGSYIVIETNEPLDNQTNIEDVGECLAEVLSWVMQPYYHGKLCICGLGCESVPADALGPEVIHNLPLKLFSEIEAEGNFREVCSIVPGTSLTNNIDTEVIVKGVIKEIGADCILLVDSLIAKNPARLLQTIQISTAGGTNPYFSGRTVNWSALGIPVISLGVPVAIPTSDFFSDQSMDYGLFTSTNIQDSVTSAGRIIAYAILRMCWPSRSKIECSLLSWRNSIPMPCSFTQEEECQSDDAALMVEVNKS